MSASDLPAFQTGRRPAVYASHAMVATSHPAASVAAIEMLRSGGNAVDAGVAAALMLSVGEPMMCGLGGDMFALYAPPGAGPEDVIAINGSGRAPAAIDPDHLTAKFGAETSARIPANSPHAVTIPCGVAGLCKLLEDHGNLEIGRVTEPAIYHAEEGLPVGPRTAFDWAGSTEVLKGAARGFYLKPDGAPYAAGERFAAPGVAEVLRRIAREGAKGFYEGDVAQDMVASLQALGGTHTLEDFATVAPVYAKPVTTRYRDVDIYTPPPNGQGVVALPLLNLLSRLPIQGLAPLGADRTHLEAEAVARAYAERDRLLCDPDTADAARLLQDPALADRLAGEINLSRKTPLSQPAALSGAAHRETVYLCVTDADGGVLSLIFSIFGTFGSGLASDRFGVLFQNRGGGFALTPDHPNRVAPHKRPMHTLIPSLAFQNGACTMAFGVMGGQYQAAGQARFLSNLFDCGMGLQEALDTPRAFVENGVLELEAGYDAQTLETLSSRGHTVARASKPIGGGQAIWIDRETGVFTGASDPRKDGCALGY